MSDSIVIIPTYNEKENIENIVRAVFGLEKAFHILVIDDGSPDGTAAIVKGLQKEFPERLFIVERKGKLGLGTAYIRGFKWAIEHKYDFIFEMDADFSHNPNDLPKLYAACTGQGADVAIGSRYCNGVNVVNWPLGRVLMSYFASVYVRIVTGMKIQDTTAGFKCYRREVLETIDLDRVHFKGYAFQVEMKFTAYKCGFKLVEVPIIFINRALGVSKMNSSIFGEALFGVLQLNGGVSSGSIRGNMRAMPNEKQSLTIYNRIRKMNKIIIQNPRIINEGRSFIGSVLVEGDKIAAVFEGEVPGNVRAEANQVIDATGKWLIPGVIDDQVHFRDPGLTHKGDIGTESRAAVAGGVTTFMDMPNTKPQTTTIADLEWKFNRAAEVSRANYSFFFGGTNDNMDEIRRLDRSRVPGLKLFLGSSTGNMLVDKKDSLERIFGEAGMLIAIHAEKEEVIRRNIRYYTNLHGEDLDISFHSKIRSEEACYQCSAEAVELATRLDSRLHILHLSTEKELSLLSNRLPLSEKKITGEVCVHHLWFHDGDYARFGNRIKWNPAIKTIEDRAALREAVNNNTIDIVATDHAPHLPEEKRGSCLKAASGGPLIQHSLITMLELAMEGRFTYEKVVEKMAHMPAELFRIDRRGYIRPGYYADIVLIDPERTWTVSKENILYKCGWSPFEGYTFHHGVWKTFVNGELAYGDGEVNDAVRGKEVRYL